jgi:hypothetical protein
MANKMTLTPPKRTPEEFIKAANKEELNDYPWQDSKVRDDVIKSVNLRLSEPALLKLQYISEKTRKSQQELIREALLPFLDQLIEELKR